MLRRAALLLPLLPAACGGDDLLARTEFPALHYEYLTPLRLNVGTVDVPDAPPPGPLDGVNPAPPLAGSVASKPPISEPVPSTVGEAALTVGLSPEKPKVALPGVAYRV